MAHELEYKLCYCITRLGSDKTFSSIEACEAGARLFYCLVTLTGLVETLSKWFHEGQKTLDESWKVWYFF